MRNKELSLGLRSLGILLLVAGTLVSLLISVGDTKEEMNKFQFTANPDGTFSVVSRLVPLETLLSKITEATKVVVSVDDLSKKRLITIDVKNDTVVQLLKRIAGDNYAMVYDKHGVTALHVLPQGKHKASEFSGKVQVSGKRAKMFFMPHENSKEFIDDYIKKRHEALAKLAEENPHKEIQAQMSFQGYMSSKGIIALVKENKLDPVTLNIGWKEYGGGSDIQPGESIEDAIKGDDLYQKEFLSMHLDNADRQVASMRQQGMSDAQMKADLDFQKRAHDLNAIFQEKGNLYIGIQVTGQAKKLYDITKDEQTIRLVDPLWGGSVEEEVAKVYTTTKIAIPLTPEKETFVP
jgi:hypothetical protein